MSNRSNLALSRFQLICTAVTENQIKSKLDAVQQVVFSSLKATEGKDYLESLDLFSKQSKGPAGDQVQFGTWRPKLARVTSLSRA